MRWWFFLLFFFRPSKQDADDIWVFGLEYPDVEEADKDAFAAPLAALGALAGVFFFKVSRRWAIDITETRARLIRCFGRAPPLRTTSVKSLPLFTKQSNIESNDFAAWAAGLSSIKQRRYSDRSMSYEGFRDYVVLEFEASLQPETEELSPEPLIPPLPLQMVRPPAPLSPPAFSVSRRSSVSLVSPCPCVGRPVVPGVSPKKMTAAQYIIFLRAQGKRRSFDSLVVPKPCKASHQPTKQELGVTRTNDVLKVVCPFPSLTETDMTPIPVGFQIAPLYKNMPWVPPRYDSEFVRLWRESHYTPMSSYASSESSEPSSSETDWREQGNSEPSLRWYPWPSPDRFPSWALEELNKLGVDKPRARSCCPATECLSDVDGCCCCAACCRKFSSDSEGTKNLLRQ
eukprot:Blabericola_migrator_1__3912@NODE_2182_length_3160_cov_87_228257_g1375_i0_p2_GENE_NODE_2182_length_3160_cov_87_228257_g1375_i0NODE_2182_length_3160_cov_87_228257_g1375_i0_p2_ORF_typecomplete_len400_score65_91_NODE_2182_length_3160_cov_87_228257_g1375_i018523051